MEQNWPCYHGMYQGHYSDPRHPGGAGPTDRHQSSPHNELTTSPTEETNHRRAYTQPVGGTFLPPLPPLQSSSHPNHPSFSPDFYPSYSPHAASTSAPAGLHMAGYPNEPMSAPPPAGQGGYQYQLTSPLNQSTQMRGEESEDQPYGLPQDEYKALNPRDKKKVRNRIGARRFRAKRKNYVSSLEQSLRARDDELSINKAQMDTLRNECNDLRGWLGMPLLSPPVPMQSSMPDGALEFVVNQVDGWSPKGRAPRNRPAVRSGDRRDRCHEEGRKDKMGQGTRSRRGGRSSSSKSKWPLLWPGTGEEE